MTKLTQKDFSNFWRWCYLKPSSLNKESDLIDAAIRRAYNDFKRTAHGINYDKYGERWENVLRRVVVQAKKQNFNTQDEFDGWHKRKCDSLRRVYHSNTVMTYGQTQKWINMTLKYCVALGILQSSERYKFFHFPIDEKIMEEFHHEYGLPPFRVSWSRVDDYRDYLEYQKVVRHCCRPEISLKVEFRLFMQ